MRLFFFLGIMVSLAFPDDLDRIVENILMKRVGPGFDLEKLESPFVLFRKEENASEPVKVQKIPEPKFRLLGVINDRANIDGVWVADGEFVHGMRVHILPEGKVELTGRGRTVTLPEKPVGASWMKIRERR